MELAYILSIALTLTSILAGVFIYTTFNLLKKLEKSEDILESYIKFFKNQTATIIGIERRLNEIDARGIFESDDEIGWFWSEIKKLKESLSQFKFQ